MKYLIDGLLLSMLFGWLAAYVGICRAVVKALRKGSRSATAGGAVADSMGQTFCAMSILVTPFLMAFLASLLGPVGCFGATVFALCACLGDRSARRGKFAPALACWIFGICAVSFGLAYSAPYSTLPALFPVSLHSWSEVGISF